MLWHLLLVISAWVPIVLTVVTVWFAAKLLFIPAGLYSPWRRAWTWLMIGVGSIGMLWLRNALVTTGLLTEDSWIIQLLFSLPLRLALSSIAAAGFCGCAWECYRIFQQPPSPEPIPVAQVIMNWKGNIIGWNDAATALLGWTAEEAIGHELAALMIPEDFTIDYHGTSILAREAHRKGLQHFHETGESVIMNTRFPTQALHKDGRRLTVEVRVNSHITSIGTTFLGQIVEVPVGVPPALGSTVLAPKVSP